MLRLALVLSLLALACGPADTFEEEEFFGMDDEALLLNRSPTNDSPLPCADPTVVSAKNQGETWFVYCTGMSHVWKTSDWKSFSDVADQLDFDFTGMKSASRESGSWWAPSVSYDPGTDRYVMWVSVIDGQDFANPARSLAVFTAPQPLGKWTFRRVEKNASEGGQMFIDPSVFRARGGNYFLYWKQYGPGLNSSIMGARLDDLGTSIVAGTQVEIINGYGGPGTWEDNCRENPSLWENRETGALHMLYSGNSWKSGAYATGHAVSKCGPLCVNGEGSWHVKASEDRGVAQVVQAKNLARFDNGGPGGAVWLGKNGLYILYAAAHRSNEGIKTRYLFRERVQWSGGVPYVDTARHNPRGF